MFKLLIVGRSEDIAKEAALWAVSEENKGSYYMKQYEVSGFVMSIRVYPLWIEQKARKPAGDGLLLVARAPGDLQAMEGFIKDYKGMPIKFVLYDGAPEEPGFEAKWDAKPLPKGLSVEFVDKLIAANNELVKRVAKVFKTFDTEKTNKIDVGSLKSMVNDLGKEFVNDIYRMDEEDVKNVEEGLASLEDLMEWWKSGGRDNPSQMGGVIKAIIEENPYIQVVVQSLNQLKIPNQAEKMVEGKFSVHANKVEAPGLSLSLAVKTCGNSLNSDFQEFEHTVGIGNYDPFIGIAFRTYNPAEALTQLQNLVNSALVLGKSLSAEINSALGFVEFKYGASNEKVFLCVVPSDKGASAIDPILSLLNSVAHIIVANQLGSIDITFATDLDKISTEDRPFFELLLDGVTANMDYKANPDVNKYLNHMQASSGALNFVPKKIRKMLTSILFVTDLIKSTEGELEFEVTQDIKEAISELIDDEEAKVSLKLLKEGMGESIREKIEAVPLLSMVHTFFKESVIGVDIFTYVIGLAGVKFSASLPGLSTLLTF
eukprot:TRINITY_DN762_c0_g1_i1.p1 TRINITY_DN762_c0_g1~~TRINITY_DN762_c0_g1_i1.p1  ORF type:complete len:544 (+),score=174.46 TRINITY_DN762_c0_g1_i1:251-1882(+)